MDPDATWDILNDDDWPFDERVEAAEHLANWLWNGGFVPTNAPPVTADRLNGFCRGFVRAARAVRAMPEITQLRTDLLHVAEKNTQHIVDSSARLLEALDG